MTTLSSELCPECRKVETDFEIDIQRLLKDLAKYKGNELTEKQKLYLCLSLLGYEPIDIAKKENYQDYYNERKRENKNFTEEQIRKLVNQNIKNRARNISNFLSESVNQYIIDLITNLDDNISFDMRPPWLRIICLLKDHGYKKDTVPIKNSSNRKMIVIESENETDLQKIIELIEFINQKFGYGSLKFENIESEESEDNEQQN